MALEVAVPAREALEVRPVADKRELNVFIKLPWRLYRNEPRWVPPLLMDRKRFLDRQRNPFFKHAEAEFFLAWRNGRPVGRISAQIDRNFNEYQHHDWGMFGFFECEPDPEAAQALLTAAEEWLRARGRDRMVGPMSFTTNDEAGILIDGYDLPPTVLTELAPPLLPGADRGRRPDQGHGPLHVDAVRRGPGLGAPGDLAGGGRGRGSTASPSGTCARRTWRRRSGASSRSITRRGSATGALSPLTEEEVRHYAKDLKPVLDENWAFIAEKDGEPIAAALTLPDYNQVLRHLNGRLLPFGWVKALWYRRKIDRVRVFALGAKPEWQHTGCRGQALRDALRRRRANRAEPRRDRLDAGEQQADEPRHGAHGRQDHPDLQGLREDPLKLTGGAVTMSRWPTRHL